MSWILLWSTGALAADRVVVVDQGARGSVVLVQPVIDGVPVDLQHRIRLDPTGKVLETREAQLLPTWSSGPPISAQRALDTVRARFGAAPDAHARLSWIPGAEHLRQVWTLDLGGPVPGLPQDRPLVRLDAATGLLLGIDEGAVHQEAPRARAFLTNPALQPTPATVDLPLASAALADERLELLQCRDLGQVDTRNIGGETWDFHVCTEDAADGPVAGDYLYVPEPWPADPGRDEDAFAAPHTYHNVHVGLDWFDALGWAPHDDFDPHLVVTVNRRVTDMWSVETAGDPSLSLDPYNNAYSSGGYTDWQDEWVPPVLVFGQGDAVDFAYDADVIHHELGHYIVKSQAGPSWSFDTVYGPSVQANALNEGLADYFSAAIQGDGQLAEYAGDDEPIRDLDGADTCMADLYGESHYDGQPFAQALWGVRETLGAGDQRLLDQAVLDGLSVMGTNPDFASAAEVLVDLAEERLGQGDALAAAFDARGVRDCRPIVPVEAGEPFRRFTYVPGSYEYSASGPVPGYVQFRTEIPEGGARVTLSFDQSKFLGLDPYGTARPTELAVVGQPGDEILWVAGDEEVELELDDGTILVLLLKTWTTAAEQVAITAHLGQDLSEDGRSELHHYAARWDVPEGGTYTFQLTNSHPRTTTPLDLTLSFAPIPDLPDPEPPVDDEPAAASADEAPAACGCAGTSAAPTWAVVALLAVLGRRSS